MKALGGEILQDVPGVAAVFVAMDLRVLAQARRRSHTRYQDGLKSGSAIVVI